MADEQANNEPELNPLDRLYEKGNNKWIAFVEDYVIHKIGAKAARNAGYAESCCRRTAVKLLHEEQITSEAIKFLLERQSEEAGITASKVRSDLELTRRLALADGQYATAMQCSVWQGKSIELFSDKVAHSGPGNEPIPVNTTHKWEIEIVRPDAKTSDS